MDPLFLEHLKSSTFNNMTSVKSFYFPHFKQPCLARNLKTDSLVKYYPKRLHFQKSGNRKYKYLVLGHEDTYFVKEHSDSKYSKDGIIKILEFLVENIFVGFAGKCFSRQFAFQWVRSVPLFSPTPVCIHTKRNSYSPCSEWERNG